MCGWIWQGRRKGVGDEECRGTWAGANLPITRVLPHKTRAPVIVLTFTINLGEQRKRECLRIPLPPSNLGLGRASNKPLLRHALSLGSCLLLTMCSLCCLTPMTTWREERRAGVRPLCSRGNRTSQAMPLVQSEVQAFLSWGPFLPLKMHLVATASLGCQRHCVTHPGKQLSR